MSRCPACSSSVPDGSRFCGSCGAALSARTPTGPGSETGYASAAPTIATPSPGSPGRDPSSDPLAGSRFLPGTMLSGRYRIVGLLGRGGMGEVYRADDLKIGQTVALKFLPESVEKNSAAAARLTTGIRMARRVVHPNVCSVYDVGETDESLFVSMEYVDGEDLASLLRRIGRLPREKAIQIARQLCAGLAAAHEQGILHRDLKPSNVMLDGRGRVRLTDFDLACVVQGGETGSREAAGTPAYMAPEQLAGKEVTHRSDLYALGLVLYEVFTGKPAFSADSIEELNRLHDSSTPSSPSSLVEDMDPAAERIILCCLERDPGDRPASALAVSAALPGGDPLAAALAAGETPSPEMVAASGPVGGLRLGVASAWLSVVLVGLILSAFVLPRTSLYGRVPMEKPVEALAENAREIARRLGYTDPPRDRYYNLQADMNLLWYLARTDQSSARWDLLSSPRSTPSGGIALFYRESKQPLVSFDPVAGVPAVSPSKRPGDVLILLRPDGTMGFFEAIPPDADHEGEDSPEPEWGILFELAGLEISNFTPVRPRLQRRVFVDRRAAWEGRLPGPGGLPVRLEAGAAHGKPVYFEHVVPYDSYWSPETETHSPWDQVPAGFIAGIVVFVSVAGLALLGGALVAVRNFRAGRGDRKGALRLALIVFALTFQDWLLGGHHVLDVSELVACIIEISRGLLFAVMTWGLYMAVEPHARRLWPQGMVSWSRLISGRFRDPLVGRDLLVGFAFGSVLVLAQDVLGRLLPEAIGYPSGLIFPGMTAARGGRWALAALLSVPNGALIFGLVTVMSFLLLRMLLRRPLLAVGAFAVLDFVVELLALSQWGGPAWLWILAATAGAALTTTVVIRYGFLAVVASQIIIWICLNFMLTTDVSAPYFGVSLMALSVAAMLALLAFRISTGRRRLAVAPFAEPAA